MSYKIQNVFFFYNFTEYLKNLPCFTVAYKNKTHLIVIESVKKINVGEYRMGNQKRTILSRETGNIGYTRRRKTKQKHNTIPVGHHYAQANTNNVNKTWTLLQTTGDRYEPNILFKWKTQRTPQHGTQNTKTHKKLKDKQHGPHPKKTGVK